MCLDSFWVNPSFWCFHAAFFVHFLCLEKWYKTNMCFTDVIENGCEHDMTSYILAFPNFRNFFGHPAQWSIFCRMEAQRINAFTVWPAHGRPMRPHMGVRLNVPSSALHVFQSPPFEIAAAKRKLRAGAPKKWQTRVNTHCLCFESSVTRQHMHCVHRRKPLQIRSGLCYFLNLESV